MINFGADANAVQMGDQPPVAYEPRKGSGDGPVHLGVHIPLYCSMGLLAVPTRPSTILYFEWCGVTDHHTKVGPRETLHGVVGSNPTTTHLQSLRGRRREAPHSHHGSVGRTRRDSRERPATFFLTTTLMRPILYIRMNTLSCSPKPNGSPANPGSMPATRTAFRSSVQAVMRPSTSARTGDL